ncbi:hypothetical protein CERSUDRAFT_163587 [Gelatoporia subvermispora B]|uniref:Calcineurin-like phosphoesterase domain-containing protein n=1 Tax=Ceriporiopsis subvermispora (strain B) TaxID=914234 RepID=M2Q2H5_CERS8|nr:hypothetical protein CERSUDRAFT_163587 [Gelatoporia subvermispora B]
MSFEPPFCLQILSDLHLEQARNGISPYEYDFSANAPNLALLGDIGWTSDVRLFAWLDHQLGRFERVFFVPGNNEPCTTTLDDSTARLQEFAKTRSGDPSRGLGAFILLSRTRYDASPTLTILGCTLWSALDSGALDTLSRTLSDFKRIISFDASAFSAAHTADITWLTDNITQIRANEPGRRVVVLTHHSPTVQGTSNPKYALGPTASAFATELTQELFWGAPVTFWAFGHTHWTCDFERNGVQVYSNQRGSGQGSAGFDPGKVVEI